MKGRICLIIDSPTLFSAHLILLRNFHCLSVSDFARKLSISKSMVSKFENRINFPSAIALLKMSNYFCVSIDYLLGRSDDPAWSVYLPQAEISFFNHPDSWPKLIDQYKHNKAANPISLASIFLRSCEDIRDDYIRSKKKCFKTS